jgi:hypothetical protein
MTSFWRTVSHVLVVPAVLGGCATYDLSRVPPAQAQPISIAYSSEGPSGWTDLPIGTYRVPNSDVIVSGHDKGGIGGLFGVVGVLAQDAIETEAAKADVNGGESAMQANLVPQAETLTQQLIGSGHFGKTFALTVDPNGPTLQVNPFVVLNFVNATDILPYVILKATLKNNAAGSSEWTTRYIASTGAPAPLFGEHGLAAKGGAGLHDILAVDLDRAVHAMLDDLASQHPRDGSRLVYVESAVPYLPVRMAMVGDELSDDGQTLVYAPKIADGNVFAGVHVLEDAVTPHRPATKDDKLHVLGGDK